MRDIDKARHLFAQAKLAFPAIPNGLAADLRQHGEWLYSTRELPTSPYNLRYFVEEAEEQQVGDYAVLSHTGHGLNSYAIQYYLVLGSLRIFLHLGWGGVYMDAAVAAARIEECFSLADKVVATTAERATIVGSDFYGSYWSRCRQTPRKESEPPEPPTEVAKASMAYDDTLLTVPAMKSPEEVLKEVVHWIETRAEGVGSADC